MDQLGNRMKRYESAFTNSLPPRFPIIVRIDGRAFHTYTKQFIKPFDPNLIKSMDFTSAQLYKQLSNTVLVYTQSDEINILFQQDKTNETQPPFGGKVQKMVSCIASLATAEFNRSIREDYNCIPSTWATFDARVFCVPWTEVPNYFIWRHQDCYRNAIHSIARSLFSAKELHKKNRGQQFYMIGEDIRKFSDRDLYGYFYSDIVDIQPHPPLDEPARVICVEENRRQALSYSYLHDVLSRAGVC